MHPYLERKLDTGENQGDTYFQELVKVNIKYSGGIEMSHPGICHKGGWVNLQEKEFWRNFKMRETQMWEDLFIR